MPMRLSWAATTGAPETMVGKVGMTPSFTVKPEANPASAMSFLAFSTSGL